MYVLEKEKRLDSSFPETDLKSFALLLLLFFHRLRDMTKFRDVLLLLSSFLSFIPVLIRTNRQLHRFQENQKLIPLLFESCILLVMLMMLLPLFFHPHLLFFSSILISSSFLRLLNSFSIIILILHEMQFQGNLQFC